MVVSAKRSKLKEFGELLELSEFMLRISCNVVTHSTLNSFNSSHSLNLLCYLFKISPGDKVYLVAKFYICAGNNYTGLSSLWFGRN